MTVVTIEKQASANSLNEAVSALDMKFTFLVGTSLVGNILPAKNLLLKIDHMCSFFCFEGDCCRVVWNDNYSTPTITIFIGRISCTVS